MLLLCKLKHCFPKRGGSKLSSPPSKRGSEEKEEEEQKDEREAELTVTENRR